MEMILYMYRHELNLFISSANATPQFEGRGGEELANELAALMSRAYQTRESFDLKSLSIIKGAKCWKLCIDILVLDLLNCLIWFLRKFISSAIGMWRRSD